MVNMDIMDGINDDIDNVDSLSCNLNDNGSTYDDPNNNNDKYGDKSPSPSTTSSQINLKKNK